MAAALPDAGIPLQTLELQRISVQDLDPLFAEEIGVWERQFHWDFRPSADLLRRFLQVQSLYGYALRGGNNVIGYAYHVCEGRKGLIGDFYVRSGYADSMHESLLLGSVVQGLMMTPGIRRIESQLMLLQNSRGQSLPFSNYLRRHDRYFMSVHRDVGARLVPRGPSIRIKLIPWAERYQEEIAYLVAAAYKGHVDSDINDQYRSVPGARHFLTNIIRFPGCGRFSPEGSLVAIDETTTRVCGVCLSSRVSADSGHVTQLCVLPAMRGFSLGYELLRRGIAQLIACGCETVSLTVTCSNVDAVRLYESVGFRIVCTFPALVWEGF